MKTLMMRRLPTLVLAATLIAAGCGDDDDDGDVTDAGETDAGGHGDGGHTGTTDAGKADGGTDSGTGSSQALMDVNSKAAALRVNLNLLLSEHLIAAAKTTGAALGGRSEELGAYLALLIQNGEDIGGVIGDIFNDEAESEFNRIWKAHDDNFVSYTTAVAGADEDAQAAAVNTLLTVYVPEFAEFLGGALDVDPDDLKPLIAAHVTTTKDIVDAQAAEDWPKAYSAIREGFHHMQMLGDPLAAAISAKFSDEFPGDSAAKSVDTRVTFNEYLQEHLYLATFATNAALGGRTAEFNAAGQALADNGTDIGAVVGGFYGADAETQFNQIWADHDGYFVDYTTGVATGDEDMQAEALANLTTIYVPDFSEFVVGATDLPIGAVSALVGAHVGGTGAVVDAQKVLIDAKSEANATAVVTADREAGQHMQMLGDGLAPAIVKKLPDQF